MQSRSTPPKSLIVGKENSLDSGGKMILSSGKTLEISAKQDLDLYGKQKLISYTDGKAEIGAKERMHLFGTNSLITAKDKIEYKAPKMNKLPQKGEFKYDKEPNIIDVIWLDGNADNKIKKLYQGEEASVLIITRNTKEGEKVAIEIEEITKEGDKKTNVYSGFVDNEGKAILKKIVKHN